MEKRWIDDQFIFQINILLHNIMSQINIRKEDKTSGTQGQARSEKLKEIDALYKAQIKQIYTDNKDKIEKKDVEQKPALTDQDKKQSYIKRQYDSKLQSPISGSKQLQSAKSASTLNIPESQSSSKLLNSGSENDEKVRASTFLRGESTRTMEILRRENETK